MRFNALGYANFHAFISLLTRLYKRFGIQPTMYINALKMEAHTKPQRHAFSQYNAVFNAIETYTYVYTIMNCPHNSVHLPRPEQRIFCLRVVALEQPSPRNGRVLALVGTLISSYRGEPISGVILNSGSLAGSMQALSLISSPRMPQKTSPAANNGRSSTH